MRYYIYCDFRDGRGGGCPGLVRTEDRGFVKCEGSADKSWTERQKSDLAEE